jgi:hypothetical protein
MSFPHQQDKFLTERFWERFWYGTVKLCAGWIAAGAAIGAAIILYTQAADWLKTAVWKGYSIREALWNLGLPEFFYEPTTQLLGLQKIIDTLLGWPAVALCVFAASAFAFIWLWADGALVILATKEWQAKEKERSQPETLAEVSRELERTLRRD